MKKIKYSEITPEIVYKKIVKGSVFCSEEDRIISDNYKITKDQRIGIIPPIGGG